MYLVRPGAVHGAFRFRKALEDLGGLHPNRFGEVSGGYEV